MSLANRKPSYEICPDVLWWPTLFDGPARVDRAAAENCVHIVRDLVEHGGFALSDNGRGPLTQVRRVVSDWPPGPRKRLEELFQQLYREGRWVAGPPAADPPDARGCVWATAAAPQSDGVVVPLTCTCDGADHREFGHPNAAAAADYWGAPWRQAMHDGSLSVDYEWKEEEFARIFWQPILRHATTVTIVDRYIGRNEAPGRERGAKRYRRALHCVVDAWRATRSAPASPCRLVLATGDGGQDPAQIYARLDGLRQELERGDGLSVTVDLRQERAIQVPHERWVYTGQGLWQFGGGLDLFGNGGQLAAHVYTRMSRAIWRDVYRQYHRLAEFRPINPVMHPAPAKAPPS